MNDFVKKGIDFLKKFGMDPDQFNLDQGVGLFTHEMSRGLAGNASSLMMLPTFIEPGETVPPDEPVIVLDAGGTNLRVALVTIVGNGTPEIRHFEKFPMPGTRGQVVDRNEFFDTVASYMKKVAPLSGRIGFCFSYPTKMFPSGDGELITFTKEVKAPEVEGSLIGKNLLEALDRSGMESKKEIVILNDTVATLLAGIIGHGGQKFDTYLGFILGTGLNCCYVEESKNISGVNPSGFLGKNQIINIESGKFSLFEGGVIDKEFAASTDKPGESLFEKKISGAYQGPLALSVLKKAVDENIFSKNVSDKIRSLNSLETIVMDGFLHRPYEEENILGGMCNDSDRTIMYTILDRLIERAAKLTAASLAAVVLKTGKGTDPSTPVCIAADGTTYFKTRRLRFRTEYYLKKILEEEHGVYTVFSHREDAPLIGAAVAALTRN